MMRFPTEKKFYNIGYNDNSPKNSPKKLDRFRTKKLFHFTSLTLNRLAYSFGHLLNHWITLVRGSYWRARL